jgi:quercetin dioxygenase-like cupin family protein
VTGYTLLHLPSATDIAPDHGLGEVLEGRFVSKELGSTVVGLSHQRLRPGARIPFGHRHARQEEIYVVLSGGGTANIGGALVELVPLDALRVDAQVMRAIEAGPDGLELIAVGAPIAPEQDSTIEPGWWPEEPVES